MIDRNKKESKKYLSSSMKPVVSICITTYNQKPYIAQALDSVLAQEVDFDFEILIGEDDSSDSTRAICIEYEEKYPDKIRLFLNERRNVIYIDGMATGRWNLLNNLKHAKGKYIALLEGDDYWVDSLKLQKQVDLLDKNATAAGCFHETQIILENGKSGNLYGESKKCLLTAEDTITKWSPFHTSSFMFRRSFLPDPIPEWFKKVVSADMALFMILASKGPLISIPEIMSVYRKHPGGITENIIVQRRLHSHRIKLLKYFDKYTDRLYRDKIREVISEHKRDKIKNIKGRVANSLRVLFKSMHKN